ncbi:fasciclin domain-containing protein [Maribacter sp. ACAM166]|uniref:fasciclin domain-containing protein n=1 Tax=Maribacter sp. ACAM166 TaxID=2508996 RepID=UPI0010FCE8E3|nr:fasciclin domain-containing protein [Maribacter sp. ACAM166]TLP79624.1 fasciclin domain-containing protein [Maribacter sp. ACAM166]
MKIFKIVLFSLVVIIALISCGEQKKEVKEVIIDVENQTEEVVAEVMETPTIVSVAAGDERFSTLVTAVQAANLVETLNSKGPFTVFAPTNDAFAKLPEGTVETLVKPESKETLTGILTYHVVAGAYNAADVIDAIQTNDGRFDIETIQGGTITLSLKDGNVLLTDVNGGSATVIIADVMASNGIIHAIDSVVMPKS